MLRLTAKSTQFGHRTFTSWLIESAGTVPIKRRKDFPENAADNTRVMEKLMEVKHNGQIGQGPLAYLNLTGTGIGGCDMPVS